MFLSLPPHVVSFNVYLLEANNEYVEKSVRMSSKKGVKIDDQRKLEEHEKLLQQPEMLQKHAEEVKMRQEKIELSKVLQNQEAFGEQDNQNEKQLIKKPIVSVDEAFPKNEKSLLENEAYFTGSENKSRENEANDLNSQMLVRLKPEGIFNELIKKKIFFSFFGKIRSRTFI